MFSTSTKIIFGYIIMIGLLFGAILYTLQQMTLLTEPTGLEENINNRRHTTHRIISQLYDAEIIGQTLRMGKLDEYSHYINKMKEVNASIDTLDRLLTDTLQQARLDTVRTLLKSKQQNMFAAIELLHKAPDADFYKQQLDSLIAAQDSLLKTPHIHRKVVTHQNSYTIRHKKKSFFKRLAEVFAPKEDSTLVNNVIQEEYTDTVSEIYSPADTISNILADIQHRMFETRQEQTRMLNVRIDRLRATGNALSQRVNQLLESIDKDERTVSGMKLLQEQGIRQKAAHTMANIAIAALAMVLLFSFIIARDITREKHYRKELEKSKLYAENLLMAREKLMLTITHDIKAPAGSIIGYIDLLVRLVKDKRQLFYLNNMKSSAQHLTDLITSLLDYHRLEAGKMDIQRIPFSPYELLERIYNGFLPLAEKKGLKLLRNIGFNTTLTLEGDPFRIRQIVENLLSNALKFTATGEISLNAHFREGTLTLSVTDTGCGMTKQEQQRIFREFTRLRSAQGQEGFGLGLSITRKLTELLGGEIKVNSEQGKGSTFQVSLPLHTLPSQDTIQKGLPDTESTWDRPLHILLIDDDRIQMRLTEAMLCNIIHGKENPYIQCCEQPEEVFRLLNTLKFDIVFTDLQMPAMDGIELLQRIRNLNHPQAKTIPVIAITARGDMEESDFLEKGFSGMLKKPFSQHELLGILKNVLSTGNTEEKISDTETDSPTPHSGSRFNFAPLTAFSGDDPKAALEILNTFISETEQSIRRINEASKARDMKQVCAIAHKMLPTFIMIEAKEAVPALQWLESRKGESTYAQETDKTVRLITEQAEYVIIEAEKVAEKID